MYSKSTILFTPSPLPDLEVLCFQTLNHRIHVRNLTLSAQSICGAGEYSPELRGGGERGTDTERPATVRAELGGPVR